MSEQVVLWKCTEYDSKLIEVVLKKCFWELGGLGQYVKKGQRVFLKLNLLMKKKPEEAVTTHPAVVEAMVRLLQELGATVVIGDSPGGPYNKALLKSIYKACGIEDVAVRTGAELNYDTSSTEVSFVEGKLVKKFSIIKPLLDADIYISMSKLKTHMMTKFTGAVKVNFGAIPGLVKAEYHFKMPAVVDFSDMLLDLYLCLKPTLNIMDAIEGMEGKGPSAGEVRQVGALLVSSDASALDVVAATLAGIQPLSIPTIKAAADRGLTHSMEQVHLIGHRLRDFSVKPFITPTHNGQARFPIPDLMNRALERWLKPVPLFMSGQCVSCQECVRSCPPKALKMGKKVPELDPEKCISCFCCQELCPQKAVDVKRSAISRLLFK